MKTRRLSRASAFHLNLIDARTGLPNLVQRVSQFAYGSAHLRQRKRASPAVSQHCSTDAAVAPLRAGSLAPAHGKNPGPGFAFHQPALSQRVLLASVTLTG